MQKNPQKQKMTLKQAAAIMGILLLVLLYAAAFITSLIDSPTSSEWFYLSLFATFAVPLLLWIYIWLYGRLTGKRTIADPDTDKMNPDAENFSNPTPCDSPTPPGSKSQTIPGNLHHTQ